MNSAAITRATLKEYRQQNDSGWANEAWAYMLVEKWLGGRPIYSTSGIAFIAIYERHAGRA